jgi:hypothetical protein
MVSLSALPGCKRANSSASDPVAEFRDLLSTVAAGTLSKQSEADAWNRMRQLLFDSPAVRQWLAGTFGELPDDQRFTVAVAIERISRCRVFPEFQPTVTEILRDRGLVVLGLKCLYHYEIPDRQSRLLQFIRSDCRTNPYVIRRAVDVFLVLYGPGGIEAELASYLQDGCTLSFRAEMAATVVIRCKSLWRARALSALDDLLAERLRAGTIYAIFERLAANDVREELLFEHATRLSSDTRSAAKQGAEIYLRFYRSGEQSVPRNTATNPSSR